MDLINHDSSKTAHSSNYSNYTILRRAIRLFELSKLIFTFPILLIKRTQIYVL
jgi:hypothetical protein